MKRYPNIDYGFRPESYWSDKDPLCAILRNVKGEKRRQMIIDYWDAGRLDELEADLLAEEVDEVTRDRLGKIHPSFMGGKYMPGYLPLEVEIARICLQSTTSDVISMRARPVAPGRIAYRVVDEYDTVFSFPIRESEAPLTLSDLIRQFDEGSMEDPGFPYGGLSLGYNKLNSKYTDHKQLRHFTRISSDIYAQLHAHYEHVFAEWMLGLGPDRSAQRQEETLAMLSRIIERRSNTGAK